MKQQNTKHQAIAHPTKEELFWQSIADKYILWDTPYTSVLNDTRAPHYSWFDGGKLNASVQCIDKNLPLYGTKNAIVWEGEDGTSRQITYSELSNNVNKFANLLTQRFMIKKGDRVVIYMPMIPEAIFAMLACARIGALHTVVFGGFSAEALSSRINSVRPKLIITADGASRHGKPYTLKPVVDSALKLAKIATLPVLVILHNHQPVAIDENRDVIYNEVIDGYSSTLQPVIVDSESPLFILHTSGSTGKPKGIVHTTAGYLLWASHTSEKILDIRPGDVYWCTADIGWITGHTYVVYGPLSLGATVFIYEGTLDYPSIDRWWQMIERHKISHLYTAPTAIRILKKNGPKRPSAYDLSSLRILGSVGEPINPAAWEWYRSEVGGGRCPVIDTWWQTETGGHMIAPTPYAGPQKAGFAATPLDGINALIIDNEGKKTQPFERGYLCITKPWPSMLRTIWDEDERYVRSYFGKKSLDGKPLYFSGDTAIYDEDGHIKIIGRDDDVMNVSGHRVGTAELESAISLHPQIAEVAVVSKLDEIKGESIVAFTILQKEAAQSAETLLREINALLCRQIGKVVKIDAFFVVTNLPKTRSGKLVRRLLRAIVRDEPITQDISTLEEPRVIDEIVVTVKKFSAGRISHGTI